MKKIDSKGKSSVLYIGKGVIILSIITTSSLAFLLGFFVGKNSQPPVLNQAPVVTPSAVAARQDTDPLKQEAVSPKPQQPREAQQSVQPETQASQAAQENTQPQDTQSAGESGPTQGKDKVRAVQGTTGAKKYTVQAGAFKNASEANTLKAKLNEKGYKASVAAVETKKHDKLYKVLVGEFSKKNEAALLAARIAKSEGLRTFVTVRNREELRSQ
jgi:cell division septation protein DedD